MAEIIQLPTTNKMRTAKQWFETLPQDVCEKAIRNTRPENLNEAYSDTFMALVESFNFKDSPEGAEYWYNITEALN